jgi:hypothetical protein
MKLEACVSPPTLVIPVPAQVAGANTRCELSKDLIRTRADIKFGQTNTNAAQRRYREAALDMWFPISKSDPFGRSAKRRAIVSYYLNGDWASGALQHFCAPGCCPSPDAAIRNMCKLLPGSLLPHSATRMAQHRWTRLL